MRLICPRCGAQYEIDDDAIPSGGRDVECSACEHVWRAGHGQPAPRPSAPRGPGAGAAARGAGAAVATPVSAQVSGGGGALDDPGFDPSVRPVLSRKLDDSVLDILREEAARELDARAAQRNAARAAERTAAALAGIEAASAPHPEAGGGAEMPTAQPDVPPLSEGADDRGVGIGAGAGAGADKDNAPGSAADLPDTAQNLAPPTQTHPDPRLHIAATTPPAPHPETTRRARARRRHDTGFNVAVMAALVAVALYALAPRLADQGAMGEGLMRWHAQVNEARDWLAAQGDQLIATLRGG